MFGVCMHGFLRGRGKGRGVEGMVEGVWRGRWKGGVNNSKTKYLLIFIHCEVH